MPEREFDLYLSLLSRFLRLDPAQRAEISDELRDHLEERLEELAARGIPRDEAIQRALEEFGDAAELASHFTRIAHIRRRRLIMRCTVGTVTALAASLLIAAAFWPQTPDAARSPVLAPALAQASGSSAVGAAPGGAGAVARPGGDGGRVVAPDDNPEVAAKLDKQLEKNLDLQEVPLRDALQALSDITELDILVNSQAIGEAGISIDNPVNLSIKHTRITARTALDLILEANNLSYTIRDGLILVTTAERASEIQVYNVRDLVLQETGGAGMQDAGGGSASSMRSMTGVMGNQVGAGGGSGPMGGPGMGGMGGGMGIINQQTSSIATVISTTIDPNSWDVAGGPGSIVEYNGLLVVKNSQSVHSKVQKLLELMRASLHPAAGAAGMGTGAMPGGAAPAGGAPGAGRGPAGSASRPAR